MKKQSSFTKATESFRFLDKIIVNSLLANRKHIFVFAPVTKYSAPWNGERCDAVSASHSITLATPVVQVSDYTNYYNIIDEVEGGPLLEQYWTALHKANHRVFNSISISIHSPTPSSSHIGQRPPNQEHLQSP